jgi:hypothetical protein
VSHRLGRPTAALATFLFVMLVAGIAVAFAQSASPDPQSTSSIEFLPRYDFHLDAQHLSSSDPRFVWDANFGGAVDFVDYGFGRATFLANYQVILGEEFRNFDPNQGNYTLEGSASGRFHGAEAALVFHHISRHLADRPKTFAIDWNMLGGRVQKAFAVRATQMNAHVDLRGVILHSYVDYRWELEAGLHNVHRLASRVAAVSGVDLRLLGVDGSQNRGTQTGARGEGGVRLEGKAGAVELFVAVERRIDPYPTEFGTDTWASAGFRLLSR